MYNVSNIDNNASYLLKLKLKSVNLDNYRKRFKKIKNEKEFSSLVFDLIGAFTKLESATESAIKTNTE